MDRHGQKKEPLAWERGAQFVGLAMAWPQTTVASEACSRRVTELLMRWASG
jgi:hypothetical protein